MMDGVSVDKKHLRFMVPFDGMVTSDIVKVTNDSDTAITFKMKTTTDKNGFVVQPKTGIVAAGTSTEITIIYKCDIERNPRLRLDVVPFDSANINTYGMSSAEFWERREAVFRSNGRTDSETTEQLTLASLPLYKYNFHVALLTFDERKKQELDSILEAGAPQRNGLMFESTKSTDSILVENYSNAPVLYRVRSTDATMFRTEPSSGQIEGNSSVEVICVYNGNRGDGIIDRKHFFQVDVANLAHDNPPQFWKAVDSGKKAHIEILKHKFKVQIEQPSRYSMDSSPTSSCIGVHGMSFRSHQRIKKPRHDSTSQFRFNSNVSMPSWYGTAFDKHNHSNYQSRSHYAENYYDTAPSSIPNVNFKDVNRRTNKNKNRPQGSSRTLSRTISDVWDNLRRQPSFLLSRNSRRLERV